MPSLARTPEFPFVKFKRSPPAPPFTYDPPGAQIIAWFQALFNNATTYASVLASVMFSVLVLDLNKDSLPKNAQGTPHSTPDIIRYRSAVGAILFVTLVLLCQGFALLFNFHERALVMAYDARSWSLRLVLTLLSLAFQGLLLAGTAFFCLVVKAYVPVVGKVGFGLTLVFVAIAGLLWFFQARAELNQQWKMRVLNRPWATVADADETRAEEDRAAIEGNERRSKGKSAARDVAAEQAVKLQNGNLVCVDVH